ncbi:MAG: hypothetical protein LBI03_06090 [Clostridiales bacterium]|jgi:hypothetical protein|nr:hypothetical protein [Clostridiales bacterium]
MYKCPKSKSFLSLESAMSTIALKCSCMNCKLLWNDEFNHWDCYRDEDNLYNETKTNGTSNYEFT